LQATGYGDDFHFLAHGFTSAVCNVPDAAP
jgi:hypothetical protein